MKNLTVLCGANAVGKSSIFQALLLIRSSFLSNAKFRYLDLKSRLVEIGFAKDALYHNAENDIITFQLCLDNQPFEVAFQTPPNDLQKTVLQKAAPNIFDNELLIQQSLFNTNFQFLSAARLSPQKSYQRNDVVVEIEKQISQDEGKAEYCIHYLNYFANQEVLPAICNKAFGQFTDLLNQVNYWERAIFKGVHVNIQEQGNLGFGLTYSFELSNDKTPEFSNANVGFGLTYTLPVVVAILSAQEGALLLIENPEAHLHPNGIAKLTELICLAAQAGIQIVIETHSDHIINGILVQCKKMEMTQKGIEKENVAIYNFTMNEEEHHCEAEKINIEVGGKIRYTPKAFFDQFTIDRKYLMGF